MPKNGRKTKENILDAAESLVLEHGFGATSIDQILALTGITKGAFFYHFKNKATLAHALIDRYVVRDNELLHGLLQRAESLSRDPLQQYLLFIGLLEEALRDLTEPLPGCLIASFTYQFQEFDNCTQDAVVNGFKEWHRVLEPKLQNAHEKHQPVFKVGPSEIIDNLLSLFEGGVILAKMYEQSSTLAQQLRHHRNYVELLYDLH
jgi:TetR/AcrR family transcriptional repressor of nem operon